MDRIIKFRGLSTNDSKWVYGFGVNPIDGVITHLYDDRGRNYIKAGTEGQFTGLTDRNGVEIYEGDIIRIFNDEDDYWDDEVSFHMSAFFSGDEDLLCNVHFRCEVVGNIYENSDLLATTQS